MVGVVVDFIWMEYISLDALDSSQQRTGHVGGGGGRRERREQQANVISCAWTGSESERSCSVGWLFVAQSARSVRVPKHRKAERDDALTARLVEWAGQSRSSSGSIYSGDDRRTRVTNQRSQCPN